MIYRLNLAMSRIRTHKFIGDSRQVLIAPSVINTTTIRSRPRLSLWLKKIWAINKYTKDNACLCGLMSTCWPRGTKIIDSVNCRVTQTTLNKSNIYIYIFTSKLDFYFEDNHFRGVQSLRPEMHLNIVCMLSYLGRDKQNQIEHEYEIDIYTKIYFNIRLMKKWQQK